MKKKKAVNVLNKVPHRYYQPKVLRFFRHYLNVTPRVKTIQLVDELEHGPLHLIITTSSIVKPFHKFSYVLCYKKKPRSIRKLERTSVKIFFEISHLKNISICIIIQHNMIYLAPPTASISSKKMRHAFLVLAISNNSLTIRAPSPTYLEKQTIS
jgi:hypothetical protein